MEQNERDLILYLMQCKGARIPDTLLLIPPYTAYNPYTNTISQSAAISRKHLSLPQSSSITTSPSANTATILLTSCIQRMLLACTLGDWKALEFEYEEHFEVLLFDVQNSPRGSIKKAIGISLDPVFLLMNEVSRSLSIIV